MFHCIDGNTCMCILVPRCYGNKCPSPLIIADTSTSRREAVRKKTSEYLQYTEVLQDKLRSKQAVCCMIVMETLYYYWLHC